MKKDELLELLLSIQSKGYNGDFTEEESTLFQIVGSGFSTLSFIIFSIINFDYNIKKIMIILSLINMAMFLKFIFKFKKLMDW